MLPNESLQCKVSLAANRLYYLWYKYGCRIIYGGVKVNKDAEKYWGFLHNAHKFIDHYTKSVLLRIASIVEVAAHAQSKKDYEKALGRLLEEAECFVTINPYDPISPEFTFDGWDEVCEQECCLHAPDGRREDD